ncbi:hypothetical protein BP00DRAFT_446211 [Aspergillus indologenus CBS 114.80]|uniref:Uncharacterized protein n=1 Tax=Aspergillus indologenus CBS 114.80 TaxID=1450541 RepID=A0A2V5IC69_9EURO|nr:hypothetical protein BP00DRAFT_446211 [Aspergillus indologenus CBS 114.80]
MPSCLHDGTNYSVKGSAIRLHDHKCPLTFPAHPYETHGRFQIFMPDLSIPAHVVTTTTGYPLVPRVAANETNRLHWWQGNPTPAGWEPSAAVRDGAYLEATADSRYNFSLVEIAQQVGPPVAANYYLALKSLEDLRLSHAAR